MRLWWVLEDYQVLVSFTRRRQPTPVFWPGESHGQRSLAGHGPWGHRESDMTEATKHTLCAYIFSAHETWEGRLGASDPPLLGSEHPHGYIVVLEGLWQTGRASTCSPLCSTWPCGLCQLWRWALLNCRSRTDIKDLSASSLPGRGPQETSGLVLLGNSGSWSR